MSDIKQRRSSQRNSARLHKESCEDLTRGEPEAHQLDFPGDLLQKHMFTSIRGQTADAVHDWVERSEVLAVLKEFKENEIDDGERYEVLCTFVGTKKEIDDILALADDIAKLSTTVVEITDQSEDTPSEKQFKRLAKIIQKLVKARKVPGGEESGAKKGNQIWKHKAAACLLFTVLMDLHRASDGYFGGFLGGPVVEKWANSRSTSESIDLKPTFSDPKLLKGRAENIAEVLRPDDPGDPVETVRHPEGAALSQSRKKSNRRALSAGLKLQSRRKKKVREQEPELEEGDDGEAPPYFHRNRKVPGAAGYNLNHVGDAPKPAKVEASGQGDSISPR